MVKEKLTSIKYWATSEKLESSSAKKGSEKFFLG